MRSSGTCGRSSCGSCCENLEDCRSRRACRLLVAGGLYYRSHQQSKRLTDKDTVVLADFSNSTGDPVFDDTLKTALSVALNQSPFLNVLSENKVADTLQLMTRPARDETDARIGARALPACGQQGIHCRFNWQPG